MSNFQESIYVNEILEYKLPRYQEIPDIDLYMDQIVSLMHKYLDTLEGNKNEKFITSNMINNYVKQKLLPKPIKKKYNRDHIVYLLIICLLKQIISIQEIQDFFSLKQNQAIGEIYNYLCDILEHTLQITFTNTKETKIKAIEDDNQLIHACALAFSNKIYIQKKLQYLKTK